MRNFKITVDGQVYDVSVEETAVSAAIPVVSAPAPVPIAAAPKAAPAPVAPAPVPVKAAPAGGLSLKSPMPGMVVSYKVSEGAQVKKGQVVLILEAMKMENDICAPADGKISFTAAKGSNVSTGDILAVIS